MGVRGSLLGGEPGGLPEVGGVATHGCVGGTGYGGVGMTWAQAVHDGALAFAATGAIWAVVWGATKLR